MEMLNSRIKWVASLFALIAVTFSLSAGLSANAEDRSQQGDKGANAQPKESKSGQLSFTGNREQTIESGMEPVVVEPSRSDSGALVPPSAAGLPSATPTISSITYRLGSPIMSGQIKIYEIWYGSWLAPTLPLGPKAYQAFTNNFLSLALTDHWRINKDYYYATSAAPLTKTPVGDYSIVQTNVPTNATKYKSPLSQSSIYNIAKDAFFASTGKADPNGIYVVLTSSDIKVTGFGSSFCGWHSYNAASNARYSFVGDPALTPTCMAQSVGPNLAGADAMLSVLMHELEETATDPQITAWYYGTLPKIAENGDICAWTWGSPTFSGGSYWNMNLGGKNYLIQQNFKLGALTASTSTTHTWSGTCAIR